jgi:hypothetical protein
MVKDKAYATHQWLIKNEYDRNDGKLIQWHETKPTEESQVRWLVDTEVKVTKMRSCAKRKRRSML